MKKSILAAALGLAFASGALAQPVPNGTYQFTSSPGTGYGTPPFAVSNSGSTIAGHPGAFAGSHAGGCSGIHVHGTFAALPDPFSLNCGHGIIGISGGASAIPGASGGFPGTAGGQLALTLQNASPFATIGSGPTQPSGFRFKLSENEPPTPADRVFLIPWTHSLLGPAEAARSAEEQERRRLGVDESRRLPNETAAQSAERQKREDAAAGGKPFVLNLQERFARDMAIQEARRKEEQERRRLGVDESRRLPNETAAQSAERQKREDAAKAKAGQGSGSILDSITEPTPEEIRKEAAAQTERRNAELAAASAEERKLDDQAQDLVDGLFSGDENKGKAAASIIGIATKEMQNRIARKINEKVQKIVNDAMRASTNAAAGTPRVN